MDSSSSGSSSDADADSIGSSSCTRDADDSSSACDDDGTSSTYDEEADRAACERLAERERAAAAQWRLRAAHLQLVLDITKSGLPAAIVAALKRVKVLWMLGHRAMDTLAYDLVRGAAVHSVYVGHTFACVLWVLPCPAVVALLLTLLPLLSCHHHQHTQTQQHKTPGQVWRP